MKYNCLALILVAMLAAGSSLTDRAEAQVNPDIQLGSKIPIKPEKADPVADGRIRDQYLTCAYGPHQEEIDRLLEISDPLTVDFEDAGIDGDKMFRRWNLRQCFVTLGSTVQSSISFTPIAFRYMMLEAAYRRVHSNVPADAANWVPAPRKYVSKGSLLPTATALGTMSDCIAVKDPAGADRLLRAPSGTDAERKAAIALVPALSGCIVEGQQLELTPANIRGFAADGMWQRFVAGAPTTGDSSTSDGQR